MTFLGTRKLIAAKRKKGEAIIEELVPYYSETTQALQGKTPGGHGFTLSLTGENLHGNMNRVFWPPAMIEAHESGRDIDSPALRVDLSPPEDGIGFLGIYVARDYKPSPSSEFSSPGTCIRLGRYGPFRREGMFLRKVPALVSHALFISHVSNSSVYNHRQIAKRIVCSPSNLTSSVTNRTNGPLMSKKNFPASCRLSTSPMMQRVFRMISLK